MSYRSIFAPNLFANKTILVTGGGSGIGRCTAHEIAALKGKAILIGRKEGKLRTVATEIKEDGGNAAYYCCDIRDETSVSTLVSQVLSDHGSIDGLVNNAGGQFPSLLEQITKKGWNAVMETNLTGGFLVAREVFKQYMKDHGGAIVNMAADMWGGMPGMGHSGAARAGMVNLTQTAAVEWAPHNVRVNGVAPGWIQSSGMDTYDDMTQAIIKNLRSAVPLKRMGNEAEVSGAICFLLSPAAAFISGHTIKIDGAASLGNAAIFPLTEHDKSKPFEGFHREITPDMFSNE